ncbi:hypothetical protein PIB30_051116 [Stylosanthes scabra]|uniref:Uncharacterized protein n=1 Tax=Stylosanthes scabra TaxID=79078 RepID=A0ABU6UK12_9FABA|nr:hypothetical protein [Stylosanthes scabra]
MGFSLQHLQAVLTVITDGHLDAACTDGPAVVYRRLSHRRGRRLNIKCRPNITDGLQTAKPSKPPSSPNGRLSLFPYSLSHFPPPSHSLSSISPSSDLRSEFRHRHCTRGTKLAEAATGAACGWGSSEFVQFRRYSYLSQHFGW